MSSHIPMEIQIEIVKRVPVKSLFRFRSVSKSWKSLIDSPRFIAEYNACESRLLHLISGYNVRSNPTYYVCAVDDDNFPQNKFGSTFPLSFEPLKEIVFVGSSQGLLCFCGDCSYKIAYIWNPAIRKSIAIDVPILDEMVATVLGFGVCPNTNDPMLVKINYDSDEVFAPVEVFTLSSRVWRTPRRNLPRKSLEFTWSQVAINEFIYLLTFNGLIVSFDMTSEEFAEIHLPHSLAFSYSKHLSISKLRGSLVVLEHYREAMKSDCSIWMMEKGFPKSFTKLYTVTLPNACYVRVVGFRKNGEVILDANRNACLCKVYEPSSELVKDLAIYREHLSFFSSSYTETLLLLDQADNQHIKMKFHL